VRAAPSPALRRRCVLPQLLLRFLNFFVPLPLSLSALLPRERARCRGLIGTVLIPVRATHRESLDEFANRGRCRATPAADADDWKPMAFQPLPGPPPYGRHARLDAVSASDIFGRFSECHYLAAVLLWHVALSRRFRCVPFVARVRNPTRAPLNPASAHTGGMRSRLGGIRLRGIMCPAKNTRRAVSRVA
jgi:hypothetical protein